MRAIKKNQMGILNFKSTITLMKDLLLGFNWRIEVAEQRQ